jgi:hypothetical protein
MIPWLQIHSLNVSMVSSGSTLHDIRSLTAAMIHYWIYNWSCTCKTDQTSLSSFLRRSEIWKTNGVVIITWNTGLLYTLHSRSAKHIRAINRAPNKHTSLSFGLCKISAKLLMPPNSQKRKKRTPILRNHNKHTYRESKTTEINRLGRKKSHIKQNPQVP